MGGVSCPINNRRAVDCHLRGLLADKNLVLLDLFVSEEMMIVTAAQQRRFVSIFWCDAAQSEIIQCDNVGLGAALAPHQEETRTSRGRRRMCQSAARVALHYLSAFVLAPCGGGLQVADCGCLATVSRDMKLVHTQVVASLVATDAPFTLLFFSFFFLHASLLAHQVDRSTAEDTRQTRHLANKAKSVALAAWPLGFATTKLLTSALSLWRDIPLVNSTKHSNASQHIGSISGRHSSPSDCTWTEEFPWNKNVSALSSRTVDCSNVSITTQQRHRSSLEPVVSRRWLASYFCCRMWTPKMVICVCGGRAFDMCFICQPGKGGGSCNTTESFDTKIRVGAEEEMSHPFNWFDVIEKIQIQLINK